MTDKEYEAQKKRIRRLTKKWFHKLGLGWWKIDIEYSRVSSDPFEKTAYSPKLISGKWVSVMATSADPWYRKALITCYLPEVSTLDDEELEETYLHELMHVFLSPMKNPKFAKEEEAVAQSLAKAFIWSQNGNKS